MNKKLIVIVSVAASLVCAPSFASKKKSSAQSQKTLKTINVNKREMKPLTFGRLIFRPDMKETIGIAPEQWNIVIIERLREAGYNVVGAENIVFGVDRSSDAEVILGGTISELEKHDVPMSPNIVWDLAVDWELYDVRDEGVVYKVTTRSRTVVSKSSIRSRRGVPLVEKELVGLVMKSLESMLGRAKFVEFVKKNEDDEGNRRGTVVSGEGTYRRCEVDELSLPDDMEQVQDAVVIVRTSRGMGSGFFFSGDGLLLTAAHVVKDERKVEVETSSGTVLDAEVVRRHENADIAVLRVGAKTKACLALAWDEPKAGEDVFVIGSPLAEELASSVSKGIVSGIREFDGFSFVQTDAAMNNGNSGGPVIKSNGQVIGVVSGGMSHKWTEGLGFAVTPNKPLEKLGVEEGVTTRLASAKESTGDAENSVFVDKPDPEKENPFVQKYPSETDMREAAAATKKLRIAAHIFFWPGFLGTGIGLGMWAAEGPWEVPNILLGVAGPICFTGFLLGVIALGKKAAIIDRRVHGQISLIPAMSEDNGLSGLSLGYSRSF